MPSQPTHPVTIMPTASKAPDIPQREICPPDFKRWTTQGGLSDLEAEYAKWLSQIADAEEMFNSYVYESEAHCLGDADARQHRYHLCALMKTGEYLALKFLLHGQDEDDLASVQRYVALIDGKVGGFRDTLYKWHAPAEQQDDLPESFKQAAREIEAGQIEDMEKEL
jgi:hypothetical protein